MEKWVQTNDFKVKKGELVLNIGDYIDYHDCAGKNGKDLYEGRWQVLGVSDEGNLLIVSEEKVTTHYFNKGYTLKGAMEAYSTGIDTLNKICDVYAKGVGAVSARSICIEDVDKLTGYDKATDSSYGKNYTLKNKRGTTFIWHDGIKWNKTYTNKCVTLTNTHYWYYTSQENLPYKVYNMLFGKDNKYYYWLASLYVCADFNYSSFGLRFVHDGFVFGNGFLNSIGDVNGDDFGVRAVVTLKSDNKIIVAE